MHFYLGQIVLILYSLFKHVIIHHNNLCQFRTLFVYVTKKVITSYLDDDEKADVHEKGHLPVKEINQKISLYFAGARFAFAS